MKTLTRLFIYSMLLTAFAIGTTAQAEEGSSLTFGIGPQFCYSPGYKDHLDLYKKFNYSDTGGGGWIGPQATLHYQIGDMFAIDGGLGFIFNYIKIDSGSGSESDHFNYMLIPSITPRFIFPGSDAFRVYLAAELNLALPGTGSDIFDYSNDGIGFGGFLGFTIIQHIDVELGYEQLPIKVEYTFDDKKHSESEDFGGFTVRARYVF